MRYFAAHIKTISIASLGASHDVQRWCKSFELEV